MASIIHGSGYDVLISYRQKDIKHDGFATEFVDNLQGEFESAFSEYLSIYFDIRPHDGLLATIDVEAILLSDYHSCYFGNCCDPVDTYGNICSSVQVEI